jgi:hypothetical protein
MSHLSRKSYSTVKQQLQTSAGYSSLLLSEMDTVRSLLFCCGEICLRRHTLVSLWRLIRLTYLL